MFMHDNRKEDSAKKKKERIERARATRRAYWFNKKAKEAKQNGTKKSS